MRTTVAIDDDVYEAAKTLSDSTGRSLGTVLSELARRGLERRGPQRHQVRNGIPTFEVAKDAAIIPGNRAAEILGDEGVD